MPDPKKPGTDIAPALRIQSLINQDSVKKRFEEMLGKRSASFISSVVSAVSTNKALQEADPMSVVSAAAIAASLDLPINPSLGFAYIVPYRDKGVPVAQFQVGYRGFIQLGMRSGQYEAMNAAIVYEGDLIENNRFTGSMKFRAGERTSDKIVGYVFYFKLLNGFEKYTYISKENAEKHGKQYSQSYKKGFGKWIDDFDAMALKTVIKQGLSKWGILSVEIQRALETDQAAIDVEGKPMSFPDAVDAEELPPAPAQKAKGPQRLNKLVGSQKPDATEVPKEEAGAGEPTEKQENAKPSVAPASPKSSEESPADAGPPWAQRGWGSEREQLDACKDVFTHGEKFGWSKRHVETTMDFEYHTMSAAGLSKDQMAELWKYIEANPR